MNTNQEDLPAWLTPAQVRDYLGLHGTKTVSSARKRGRLTYKWCDDIGGYVYSRASVCAYMRSSRYRSYKGRRSCASTVPAAALKRVPTFKRADAECIVYAVEAVGLGRFKVGSTTNIQRRVQALAVTCPVPLDLVHWEVGRRGDEAETHDLLAAQRVHGEWFEAERVSVVAAIESACARE